MPDQNETPEIKGITLDITKWKSTATLSLGILLMIASMYINSLSKGTGDIGIVNAQIIIALGLIYIVYTVKIKKANK